MKTFLDHFAAILGAMTIALLLMSVSHEYGYFTFIGRHFQTLLTTTDYLANGVLWLPLALFLFLFMNWGLLEKDLVPKIDRRNWTTWLTPVASIIFLVSFLAMSPWPPYPGTIIGCGVFILFAWGLLWRRFHRPIGVFGNELNTIYRQVFKIGPPLLTILFIWGSIEGFNDLNETSNPYLVQFKNRDYPELRIALRSFDRGLLTRNAISNQIEFHKWDSIVSLKKQESDDRTEPLGCYLYSFFFCGSTVPPPNP